MLSQLCVWSGVTLMCLLGVYFNDDVRSQVTPIQVLSLSAEQCLGLGNTW